MCKIKEYTPRMLEACDRVSFRLDFYSSPKFASDYTQMVYGKYERDDYARRELTDAEKLTVDVDSAAETFGMNIGDLIERKNFIFRGLKVDKQIVNLYISPFYLFASLDNIGKFDIEELSRLFANLNIDGMLDQQALQNITVMTSHKVAGETEENVFDVLDRSAFPIMDDVMLTNGRYVDTHDYEKCSIDLLRIIRKGDIDGMPRVEVSLQTRAVPAENLEIDEEPGVAGQLSEMLSRSIEEVTRCFK